MYSFSGGKNKIHLFPYPLLGKKLWVGDIQVYNW